MKHDIAEMVWPVEGYTDKIHTGLKIMFQTYPLLTFTRDQMKAHIAKGYTWLVQDNDKQKQLLNRIIKTGIQKLIQAGRVKLVTSNVAIEPQWISVGQLGDTAYKSITSQDDVAQTDAAKHAIKGRALNAMDLWKLNRVNNNSTVRA